MSAHILAAMSHLPQLRGSLRHTAQRLAYFANIRGTVSQRSYRYLAADLHVSDRTIMRHVARLEELSLLTRQTVWLASRQCAINVYQLSLAALGILHICDPDTVSGKQAKREKSSARAEEKPTMTEAGARWYASYRRSFGLAEAPP